MSNRPVTVHGARILVYINGVKFGRCASFSPNISTDNRELKVIDSLTPMEIMPTGIRISWTMEVYRSIADGGIQGVGMSVQQAFLSRQKYFTLSLVERTSGLPIFKSDFCLASDERWQVAANSIMKGTISGSALVWNNDYLPTT